LYLAVATRRDSKDGIKNVRLSSLRPSRHRLRFREEEVGALEESISRHGLLHPIVARNNVDGGLEVISGHRRLEALRRIGKDVAPCKIVEATDSEAFEISLVENLQRKSINPIEEALAFHEYVDVCKWGTQKSLANRIGKSPEYISHRLQLLQLPREVVSKIGSELSTSHAEELAWLDDPEACLRIAKFAEEKDLSVKDIHQLVGLEKQKRKKAHSQEPKPFPESDFHYGKSPVPPEEQMEEIIKTSALALRYLLYYLDNSIGSLRLKNERADAKKFLMNERYKVHQVLDDFISAEVVVNRAINHKKELPSLIKTD
jgi:ParB family chromosome partitioning protein